AQGTHLHDRLLLFTAAGRGICYPLDALPGGGLQILNRDEDDAIVSTLALPETASILLVTADGYARRLPLSAVHAPEKANDKGRVLLSRRPLAGAAEAGSPLVALTAQGLVELDPSAVPLEPESTRSHRLLRHGDVRLLLDRKSVV